MLGRAMAVPVSAGPPFGVDGNLSDPRTRWSSPQPLRREIACFAAGTGIETTEGRIPVEALAEGDLILTEAHGPQVLRAVGRRRSAADGAFAPVRFAPGAIGNDAPLLVSPSHRVLLRGWRADLMFAESEVLVAAGDLVDGDMIRRLPMARIDYFHLLLDRHEIILAEGAAAESFDPAAAVAGADSSLAAGAFWRVLDRAEARVLMA